MSNQPDSQIDTTPEIVEKIQKALGDILEKIQISGETGLGIGSGLLQFDVETLKRVGKLVTEGGGVVHVANLLGVVTDPATGIELLKEFDDPEGKFLSKGLTHGPAPELVGATGETWKIIHKVLEAPFRNMNVREYIPAIQDSVNDLIKDWKDGETIDFQREVNLFGIKILFENLFGKYDMSVPRLELVSKQIEDLQEHLRRKAMDPKYMVTTGLGGKPKEVIEAEANLEMLADELIEENKNSNENNVLVHMVKALQNGEISKVAFVEVLKELIIAGHKTLANTIVWTAIDLWQNQAEGLLDQAYKLFAASSVTDIADKRTASGALLKEIENKYAQTIIFFRQAKKDITLSNGVKFRGSVIAGKGGEHIIIMLQDILDNLTNAIKKAREENNVAVLDRLMQLMDSISIFSAGVRKCLGEYYAQIVIAIFYKIMAENGIVLEPVGDIGVRMPAGILTAIIGQFIVHRNSKMIDKAETIEG